MHQVLIAKVDAYFAVNKINKTGNWKLYLKTIFWLTTLVSTYMALILLPHLGNNIRLLLCGIHGLSWACIGFNVVHDAAHGSYSGNKKLNNTLSHLFDLMGASNRMWRSKHNIAHHTYTNIEELDDDIETMGLFRLSPNQERKKYHKFQAFYATPLYSILYIVWISKKDFDKYRTGMVGSIPIPKMNRKEKIIFWLFKVLYAFIYLVLPVILFGWVALLGYLVAAMICGVTISIVFQLAHIVGKTQFPNPTPNNEIESDFAIHQVVTTADFATKNRLISWFVGGLNFQTIHHLFPKISHVHYPAIQKIAKDVFKEYGVTYNHYRTMIGAVIAHYAHLWNMGRKRSVVS
jgi:linoleoyl-CoA desaturase